MNYKISDFIFRIKNAARARRIEIVLPFSKLNREVGKVLVKEGFLEDIKEETLANKKVLKAKLVYERRMPKFSDAILISKPSLRKYVSSKQIPDIEKRGKRTLIISTSSGIMTGRQAYKKGLGGQILFSVW